jgi:hypothetical protein
MNTDAPASFSLDDKLNELSSVLQSTRSIIDTYSTENSFKNMDNQAVVVANLTSCLKDLLYFLKSSLTAMKNSGIEIDLPEEFVQESTEEEECEDCCQDCDCTEEDEDEDEDDEESITYVVRVDDQIIGYTKSEEDAIRNQNDYIDNIIQNYHNNFYYRYEKSEDDRCITYYGFNRNTIFRWEQVLFSVSYEKVNEL